MERYLSLKTGNPIALIRNGNNNGKVVGLVVNHKKIVANASEDPFAEKKSKKKLKKKPKEDDDSDSDEDCKETKRESSTKTDLIKFLLDKLKQTQKEKVVGAGLILNKKDPTAKLSQIVDNIGDFEYIPNIDIDRECLYICGPSGSGKSYFAAKYAKKYKKLFPGNKIYLFSTKFEDNQLDEIGLIRINIDDELLEVDLDWKEFADSLCIFDDVDALEGKKDLAKMIWGLRDALLKNGRSQRTYMLNTIHEMFGYRSTRTCLSESHMVVFFPNNGSDNAVKRYLKEKGGLDKDLVDNIMRLPSRWVGFYTYAPRFIVWEHGVKLL